MANAIWNFAGLVAMGDQTGLLTDTNRMFDVHLATGLLPTGGVVVPSDFTEASFDGYALRQANFGGGGGLSGGDYYQLSQEYRPIPNVPLQWHAGPGVAGSPETVTGYFVTDRTDGAVWWWRTFDTTWVVDTPGHDWLLVLRVRWRGDT